MSDFYDYSNSLYNTLNGTQVTDYHCRNIDTEEGFFRWVELTKEIQQKNRTIYFVGNGASAMMASHMAADASKNGNFRSLAFNDVA